MVSKNTMIAPATAPGQDKGSTTCQKVRQGRAPRFMDASSMEGSMARKEPYSDKIMKGRNTYIRPTTVASGPGAYPSGRSVRPSQCTSCPTPLVADSSTDQ